MHPTLRYFLLFYLRVYLRHKDREKKHVSKKVKSYFLLFLFTCLSQTQRPRKKTRK